MIRFGSIEQFRNIIRELRFNHDYVGKDELDAPIYQHTTPYPTLVFNGTVKLHGTNAGIVKYKDRIEFQSRENVLSLQKDNAQFMLNMSNKNLDFLFEGIEFEDHIAVFGEWCGQGIQKGVAVSQLPRMFVIFGCNIDGIWVDCDRYDNEQQIYNIIQFPQYQVEIDFNKEDEILE